MLAMARRVFFLLLSLLFVSGILLWALAPDLKSQKTEIESFLRQELELKELTLGELSWYWAGHLGLKSDSISFTTMNDALVVRNNSIAVNISTLDLMLGKVSPIGVHLGSGEVQLALDEIPQADTGFKPVSVTLEDVNLSWRYGNVSGKLEHFTLAFSGDELIAQMPGTRMRVQLDSRMLPVRAEAKFSDLKWLPEQWQAYVEGGLSGKASLTKPSSQSWSLNVELASKQADKKITMLTLPKADFSLPLSSLKGQFELQANASLSSIERMALDIMEWQAGESLLVSKLDWHDGVLKLSASSSHVEMPHIWRALKPLGNTAWHKWLESMHGGVASNAVAKLEMNWATPLQALPAKQASESLKYHVSAHVEDADISLGLSGDAISGTKADVELDQHGLKAEIASTRLPHGSGLARGELNIPWNTLMIGVSGTGDVDVGQLHMWNDKKGAKQLHWSSAPAQGDFSIQWLPSEATPRKADVNLRPVTAWALQPKGIPVRVTSGSVNWSWQEGIHTTDLIWSTPHLDIKMDMFAKKDNTNSWNIIAIQANAEGDLATLSSYLLLPIESPGGLLKTSLIFDGSWRGSIDLKDAHWSNFLGVKKNTGQPLTIHYRGKSNKKTAVNALFLERVYCDNKLLRFTGDGKVSASGLRLNLQQLETASFAGAIDIRAPFGSDPWELDVDASYLNRNALPAQLNHNASFGQKPWALRAKLKRFVWDDAEIKGASIRLASALNSIAVLKAESLSSGDLYLKDISSVFSMPGGGKVSLRLLEARMEELRLKLSATLTPESERGMHWSGFAELDGNFGDMMKTAELSNVFEDGDMRLLFSGQGEFFSDQPWWRGLDGRVRLRVDDGRVMKGGTLTKFFAAISLVDLPGLFLGSRDDLTKEGLGYKRLQMEATMQGKDVEVHTLALRSSAMDVAGKGVMDLDSSNIDLILVARPFQNLDALLSKVPIVRDMFGGAAHSLIRRVYRMYGPIANSTVEQISVEEAGLASPGVVERLLNLPEKWFGKEKAEENKSAPDASHPSDMLRTPKPQS